MVFALSCQMHIHLCKGVFMYCTHTIIPFSCTLLLLSQSDHLLQWHFQSPEKERLLCFVLFSLHHHIALMHKESQPTTMWCNHNIQNC